MLRSQLDVCEFMDTTPNYLFFGPKDEDERLSPAEKEMIKAYRNLDDGRKKCIQDTLGYFRESNTIKKGKISG